MPEDFAAQQTLERIATENAGVRTISTVPIDCPEVDAFLAQNAIEPHAVARLRRLPMEHQLMVIQNSLKGARDPSAVLLGRITKIITTGVTGAPMAGREVPIPGYRPSGVIGLTGLTGVQSGTVPIPSQGQPSQQAWFNGSSRGNQVDHEPKEDWQVMNWDQQGEVTYGGQSGNRGSSSGGGTSFSNPFNSKPVTRKPSPERSYPERSNDPMSAAIAAAQQVQQKLAAKEAEERESEAARGLAQRQAQEAQQQRQEAQLQPNFMPELPRPPGPVKDSRAAADDAWEEPSAADLAEFEASCEGMTAGASKPKAAPTMPAFGAQDNLLEKLSEQPKFDPMQAMQLFFGRKIGGVDNSSTALVEQETGSGYKVQWKTEEWSQASWSQPSWKADTGFGCGGSAPSGAGPSNTTGIVDDTAFTGGVFSAGRQMSAVQMAIQEELDRQQRSRANKLAALSDGTGSAEFSAGGVPGGGSSFSVNDFDLLAPHVGNGSSTTDQDEANAKAFAVALKAAQRQQAELAEQQSKREEEQEQEQQQKAYEDYWVQQQLLSQRQLFETQKILGNVVGTLPEHVTGSKIPMAPGDWACPSCNDHQFARNRACRRCGAPRPAGAGNRLA